MSTSHLSGQFSITRAKSLVRDLSQPNASIYWFDFIVTIAIGHAAFHFLLNTRQMTGLTGGLLACTNILVFTLAVVMYMRAAMFIHELVHLPSKGYRGFRIVWNLLCGIPFLIPSFLYYPHVDHHRRKYYGTDRDGEYLELSHRHPAHQLLFVIAAFVVPPAAFFRFVVMTPASWLIPGLRPWIEKRASSMVVDIFYTRGDFGLKANRTMRIQEVACLIWCSAILLRAPLVSGQLIDGFLIQAYLVSVALVLVNNVRTLGAHRWTGDGGELTFEEQLLDSVNYPHRPWITELWGPVGTRFHALHHLFPSIPYHNLGIAHRRLIDGLPKDSIYRDTIRTTLTGAILELWIRASDRGKVETSARDESHSAAA